MAPKRNYTQKTIKLLFAACGNQCAEPSCTNSVVIESNDQSDAMISAQICHIYAASNHGPRGRPGLTEKERNAPENLILLCPTHHGIVDGQHESYPANLLESWKQQHESKYKKPVVEDVASVALRLSTAASLVDAVIDEELMRLRKARFFAEFDRLEFARKLSLKLIGGEYSGGGNSARSKALAWCARTLSIAEDKTEASKALAVAKQLSECEEVHIADAFCQAAKGNVQAALSSLAILDAPSSKTAAFQIVSNEGGAVKSIDWLKDTGLSASDLDPDGKFALLQRCMELEKWDDALELASTLDEDDFSRAPALYQAAASAHLASALPLEIRSAVITQPPFFPRRIPLSSESIAMSHRRIAIELFGKSADAAKSFNCLQANKIALDFALWLQLSDPDTYLIARGNLEASLRNGVEGLRRLPLALGFGIKLDVQAVESQIDRQTAMSGGHTVETALARLALALTKQNAGEAAKYVETYRDELLKFLDRTAVTSLEIEMLAQAGSIDKARKMLEEFRKAGFDANACQSLDRIIAEIQGQDPVTARRYQFESTNSLHDLALLVEALEEQDDWESLVDVAEQLFQRTNSLQDAERFAIVLNNLEQDDRLASFLSVNENLIPNSRRLALVKGWLLFRLGSLKECASLVSILRASEDSANLRALVLNTAIASGDWDNINSFVAEEWRNRQARTPKELLRASQIGFIVQSPQARDLLFESARGADKDAHILVGAYSLATSAGIENDETVAAWFAKGIELSGPDGPVERVTLKDVFERKPEWDKREADIWKLLSEGAIPIYGAAKLLRRTLADFYLSPALSNLREVDPRKRGIIPAFAGNREATGLTLQTAYGFDATALLTLVFLGVLDDVLRAVPVVKIPHATMAWVLQEKERVDFHQPSRIRDAKVLRSLINSGKLRVFDGEPSGDPDLLAEVDDDLAAFISTSAANGADLPQQQLVVRSFPVHKIGSLMEEPASLDKYQHCLCSCVGVLKKLKSKGVLTWQEYDDAFKYLAANEGTWPNETAIVDDATLFLDDLSVSYFKHVGLLHKLKDAGYKAVISKRAAEEADTLIGYELFSQQVSSYLDDLRKKIAIGIQAGKVVVGRIVRNSRDDDDLFTSHPSESLLDLSPTCDALVVDDRF